MEMLCQFEPKNINIVRKTWPLGEDNAKEENEHWAQFRPNYALPILANWRTYRSARVLLGTISDQTNRDMVLNVRGKDTTVASVFGGLNDEDIVMSSAWIRSQFPNGGLLAACSGLWAARWIRRGAVILTEPTGFCATIGQFDGEELYGVLAHEF